MNKRLLTVMSALVSGLWLGGCVSTSGSSGGGSTVAENNEDIPDIASGCCIGFLTEPDSPFYYKEIETPLLEDAKELCLSGGGEWHPKACPRADYVGACRHELAPIPFIQLFPKSHFGGDSQVVMREYCAGSGVWVSAN